MKTSVRHTLNGLAGLLGAGALGGMSWKLYDLLQLELWNREFSSFEPSQVDKCAEIVAWGADVALAAAALGFLYYSGRQFYEALTDPGPRYWR